MPSVYLAGPITGHSFAGATNWHTVVRSKLLPGINGIAPMRGKEYLREEIELSDSYAQHAMSTEKGITYRDRFDATLCDMVLANLSLADGKPSFGTVMEIAWAWDHHKPVVLVRDPSGLHEHAMIRTACANEVDTLEDAIHIVNATLGAYVGA